MVLVGSKGTNRGGGGAFGEMEKCGGFVMELGTACGKQRWGKEEAKGTGLADWAGKGTDLNVILETLI